MSMHKKPLTDIERDGLKKHGLAIDKPSMLSDAFRLGVAWALAQQGQPVQEPAPCGSRDYCGRHPFCGRGSDDDDPVVARLDNDAVDRFAAAMKAKMAKQRAKGYYGWSDERMCPAGRLQSMLNDHIAKGDPVDIGNFAMMLWNRGESTAAPAPHPDTRTVVQQMVGVLDYYIDEPGDFGYATLQEGQKLLEVLP